MAASRHLDVHLCPVVDTIQPGATVVTTACIRSKIVDQVYILQSRIYLTYRLWRRPAVHLVVCICVPSIVFCRLRLMKWSFDQLEA